MRAIVCRKLRERNDDRKVAPALLYIHRAAAEDYSPVVQLKESYNKTTPVEDFSLLEEEFRTRLQALLEEIFNPDLSFSQTEDKKTGALIVISRKYVNDRNRIKTSVKTTFFSEQPK